MLVQKRRFEFSVTNVTFGIDLSAQIKYFASRSRARRDPRFMRRALDLLHVQCKRSLVVVKHKTSPAFGLTPTLPLSQLPHVNSTSATVTAQRRPLMPDPFRRARRALLTRRPHHARASHAAAPAQARPTPRLRCLASQLRQRRDVRTRRGRPRTRWGVGCPLPAR
jgi:hypothetical protein